MRRNLVPVLALGAVLTVGVAAFATAKPITLPPTLVFSLRGDIKPRKLPINELAPAALHVHGDISSADGTHPPALREAAVGVDRNVVFDTRGLPTCKAVQLATRSTKAARRVCRDSLVGTGVATVEVESPRQQPAVLLTRLTLFNGGVKHGTTTLFIHGFIVVPDPEPIVAIVKTTKIDDGRYGLHAVTKIPQIADGSGSILDFDFTVKRRFVDKNPKRSYVMARCNDGHFDLTVTDVIFESEATPRRSVLADTVIRPCTPQD